MIKSKENILKQGNDICKNTLMETLQIEFIDVGENFVTARMPVNTRVYQPDGILHGGATLALAESVGSFAAFYFLDTKNYQVRGIEISANHIKSVKEGFVYAVAKAIHLGKTTQLWEIKVLNSQEELVSLVKLTTIILPTKNS